MLEKLIICDPHIVVQRSRLVVDFSRNIFAFVKENASSCVTLTSVHIALCERENERKRERKLG